jgi:hypothetical protein
MNPDACYKLAVCLKPNESKSEFYNLIQAYENAFLKEKENFTICFDKLNIGSNMWYYEPLIEFCTFKKLKCKTK